MCINYREIDWENELNRKGDFFSKMEGKYEVWYNFYEI